MFWLLIFLAVLAVLALVGVDIKALIAIALIVIAIMFIPAIAAFLGPLLPTAIAGIIGAGSWWVAGLAFFLAYLIDPETTMGVVEDVAEAVGEAATIITDVASDVAGNLFTKFLTSPLGIATIGVGLFLLFGKKGEDDTERRALLQGRNTSKDSSTPNGVMEV